MRKEAKKLNPDEQENVVKIVELTDEMMEQVTGGTIYYHADGTKFELLGGMKCRYKLTGIANNGKYICVYSDDLEGIRKFAQQNGISDDMIAID